MIHSLMARNRYKLVILKCAVQISLVERNVDLSVTPEIRQRIKSMKGSDTYSVYLDKLMRSGSKN